MGSTSGWLSSVTGGGGEMKRRFFSQKGGGGRRGVKEKILNRNSMNTSSGISVPTESDNTMNEDTSVGVACDVKEGVTPSVVDMMVEKEKISSLEDTTVSESFPTLTTPVITMAGNALSKSSERFANIAYGFFLGKKVAYPVVANYVRNTWDAMLENGPWVIQTNPLILKKWHPDENLLKEDVSTVSVWVKLHGVPVTTFSEDGLSVIPTKLGTPLILDSYTSDMCMQSWGRSSYARFMIKLRANVELNENIIIAMPKITREGHYTCNVHVEYEWKPTRCSSCKVFGHIHEECLKNTGVGEKKTVKKSSQTYRGVLVGSKMGFKTQKEYRPIPKKSTASSSGNKKKGVEPTIEGTTNLVNNGATSSGSSFMNVDNSSSGTTPIIEKIEKFEDLLTSGQAILVDKAGNPLKKVEFLGEYNSEDEVASVDNDMARYMAYERVAMTSNNVYFIASFILLITEYLVNISKRRPFWSLNEDILKITILKTNTPYPSRKIRRIRACTHQRPQRKENPYADGYQYGNPSREALHPLRWAFDETRAKVKQSNPRSLSPSRSSRQNKDHGYFKAWQLNNHSKNSLISSKPDRAHICTISGAIRGTATIRPKRERVVGFEGAQSRGESKVQRNTEGGKPIEEAPRGNGGQSGNLPPLLAAYLGRGENGQPLQSSQTSIYGGQALPTNIGGNLPSNGSVSNPVCSVTPFVHWIEDYPLLDGLKMPSDIGSYDGKGDLDNFLHLFEGAIRMQKWLMPVACHMFAYTLKDSARIWWNSQKAGLTEKTYIWVESREVATNGASGNRIDSFERSKKSSWDNNRGQKNKDRFSPYRGPNHGLLPSLSKSPKEILATEKAARSFEPPPKMFENKRSRDMSKYCHFHEDYRHNTNDCRHLRIQIQEAVNSGQLLHLVKGIKKERTNSYDTPRGESKKDKGTAPAEVPILMVNNAPVIIEAKIFRRNMGQVYMDSGSSCEIIYEHCFEKLNPTIKATKVDLKTPLVGFSGECSWSIGEVPL
ncbi:reverse transcriptase domain-containing protein [Tanacetum coccineum]